MKDCIFCTNLFSSTTTLFPHPKIYTRSAWGFFCHQFCLSGFPSYYNLSSAYHLLNPFHSVDHFHIKSSFGLCSWGNRGYRSVHGQIDHVCGQETARRAAWREGLQSAVDSPGHLEQLGHGQRFAVWTAEQIFGGEFVFGEVTFEGEGGDLHGKTSS